MKHVSIVIKVVLVLLVLVVGAGGVTFLLGSKPYEFTSEVSINAMPEDVFEHLTRPELIEQWMSGVESLTPINENGEPLVDNEGEQINVGNQMVGARAECVVNENGTKLTMISEVVQSQTGRLLEVKITSSVFEITSRYEITAVRNEEDPRSDNTELRHELQVQYKSGAQLFAPFAGGSTQSKLDEDLAALKKMAESGEALAVALAAPQRVLLIPVDPTANAGGGGGGGGPPPPPPRADEINNDSDEDDDDEDDN